VNLCPLLLVIIHVEDKKVPRERAKHQKRETNLRVIFDMIVVIITEVNEFGVNMSYGGLVYPEFINP
jgi:hypothetical protein